MKNNKDIELRSEEVQEVMGASAGLDRTVGDNAVIPRGRSVAGGELFLQVS